MANIEWESQSNEQRIKNKQLKKRIKDLTLSRDEWKGKAINRKGKYDESSRNFSTICNTYLQNSRHY